MAITHGMDIAAVRQLAVQLRTSASDIEAITQQITAQLAATDWLGPDRTQFESDWTGPYTTQLMNVVQAMNDFSVVADTHANMQEQTSNQ